MLQASPPRRRVRVESPNVALSYTEYLIPPFGPNGVGDHDITEFDITESDVTFFQEFDITESDITEKGNFYNGIRYNGICYNMKLEIGITKFVTVESDITGKWKLI